LAIHEVSDYCDSGKTDSIMRAYVFVDAENHFLRSCAAAEELVGSKRAAQAFATAKTHVPEIRGFPNAINGRQFGWNPDLQLFWDCYVLSGGGILTGLDVTITRAVFACSCSGDEDKMHEVRTELRRIGFEPIVVHEPKALKRRRGDTLQQRGLLDKPKGCDIEIATRMVADAAADLYDYCFLFTSDADFMPAIKAVRAMGKIVWVFGYASVLPKRSPYLYVPDRFVDLGVKLQSEWQSRKRAITAALVALGESAPLPPGDS
jgi:hypothetical protein